MFLISVPELMVVFQIMEILVTFNEIQRYFACFRKMYKNMNIENFLTNIKHMVRIFKLKQSYRKIPNF